MLDMLMLKSTKCNIYKFFFSWYNFLPIHCTSETLDYIRIDFYFCIVRLNKLLIRKQILKEPHHTEQKIHLFNINESKNVCLHITSHVM